jgi:hypothetical protein
MFKRLQKKVSFNKSVFAAGGVLYVVGAPVDPLMKKHRNHNSPGEKAFQCFCAVEVNCQDYSMYIYVVHFYFSNNNYASAISCGN